ALRNWGSRQPQPSQLEGTQGHERPRAVQQRVGADEAGASVGASPLNPVLDGRTSMEMERRDVSRTRKLAFVGLGSVVLVHAITWLVDCNVETESEFSYHAECQRPLLSWSRRHSAGSWSPAFGPVRCVLMTRGARAWC